MKLIYQWIPWAYSNIACLEISKLLNIEIDEIKWYSNFSSVWENINDNNIWVLPVENSYAWNIHENLYNFSKYDYKVIWQLNLEVNHNLLSKENNIQDIKKVYSHPQALSQCHNYLKKHNIKAQAFWDTASAAEYIKNSNEKWIWAISSSFAWELYWLNILDKNIQDQNWNTTRFFIIVDKNSKIEFKNKSNKVSILFEARNIPASLYKCLWAFATNNVNLTKIESLPNPNSPFSYLFWLDFEGKLNDDNVIKSLEELKFFTNNIRILWEY